MSHTFTEYGVLITDGPHQGMLANTFRTLEAAEHWVANPSVAGSYEVAQREVAVTEWQAVVS